MIPLDFCYYRADTLEEAYALYIESERNGLKPLYYGGGTEVITMCRAGSLDTRAVIDIKSIPECRIHALMGDKMFFGSALTLTEICEKNLFPLLSRAAGRVADHTVRCKLTLGGNVAGTIIYREAVLPLLLADSSVELYGEKGLRRVPLSEVFRERIELSRGELIVRFITDAPYAALPYVHRKKTAAEKIDYPVITVCALKKDGFIRLGLSGACGYPFRSPAMEEVLNIREQGPEEAAEKALRYMPSRILSDSFAKEDYRAFVLKTSLAEALRSFKEFPCSK